VSRSWPWVTFSALGTTATLVVTDPDALPSARTALDGVLVAVDEACSRFRPDSELMAVNGAPGRAVAVGPVLLDALDVALRAARLTDGVVDPTVGRALRVLGYDRDFAAVAPRGAPVTRELGRVPGWHTIRVDHAASTVQVPAGVELDLGATGKAFAVDRAATTIADTVDGGVLVSLGGDVAVAGTPPEEGWPVRIADDHAAPPDAPSETVAIREGGLATSSTTVRHWRRGDEELHHIVDPSSGRPAAVCWRTVSVVAGSCVDANTASTASIVRGETAPAWLAASALAARLVRPDGTVVRVAGWPSPEEW
jgi:thiamine biosynthesis lipoprotein